MHDRLMTVATFQDAVEAVIAKNYLDSEGITACLIDENTVATDWALGNAIGGIKLQVAAGQVERAEFFLNRKQQEKIAEHEGEARPSATAIASQEVAEEMRLEREDKEPINELADKVFRTAVFGLILVPLQFYALWLMAEIIWSKGKVSPNRRWKVWVAIVLNIPLMSLIVIPALMLFASGTSGEGSPQNPVWRRHAFHDLGISIKMPHAPNFNTEVHEGPRGGVRYIEISSRTMACSYRVVVEHQPAPIDNQKAQQELLTELSNRLMDGGAVILKTHAIVQKEMPGQEWLIDFGSNHARQRIFFRGSDMISVIAFGSRADLSKSETEQYLDSFRCR